MLQMNALLISFFGIQHDSDVLFGTRPFDEEVHDYVSDAFSVLVDGECVQTESSLHFAGAGVTKDHDFGHFALEDKQEEKPWFAQYGFQLVERVSQLGTEVVLFDRTEPGVGVLVQLSRKDHLELAFVLA